MNLNLKNILSKVTKFRPTYNQVRGFQEVPDFEGGIKYHGFKYYPRFPGEKDPPYEPTKLFLVQRVSRIRVPMNYVEKKILREFDLYGEAKYEAHINIVKNTPQVNAKLWKVKHLIKITPIRFVNGVPKDGDLSGCWLKPNGDFIISPKLKVEEERIEAANKFKKDVKVLDRDTMKKQLRADWVGPFCGVCE